MAAAGLVQLTPQGLYCPGGDFFIDPWGTVDRAVITHAHADHARRGARRYVCARDGVGLLRQRLGAAIDVQGLDYGSSLTVGETRIALYPAGHVLGSAQVRIEQAGQICVVSGDYKRAFDPTCRPFEPVRCHTFITESTFGLPIYRWPDAADIHRQIDDWWRQSAADGRNSVLFTYALGKAQRVLGGLVDRHGPIICQGAVEPINAVYRAEGIELPATQMVSEARGERFRSALVIAPPSAQGTTWMRRFGDAATAFASGWMLVRGTRRRRAVERGFVLSDHADWDGLVDSIRATGAERVLVTHGSAAALARWLSEQGWDAAPLATRFVGEGSDEGTVEGSDDGSNEGSDVGNSETEATPVPAPPAAPSDRRQPISADQAASTGDR